MTIRCRGVFGLVLLLPLLLAACAAPVTVERVDPRSVHRELTANVLTVGEESGASRNVLYRWDLTERFESDPEGALAQLHAAVAGGRAGRDELFTLAELSFLHAERTGKQEYYLAAAVYAYALLFPNGAADPLYPVDPRLRVAADLYNRGLTSGFASADRSVIELRGGTWALPFGELTVELDPKWLRWGDRRLVNFVPVAELEVRGLRERYRRPGIGAPLAAGTAAFIPDTKLRDFVGRATKVPVTALLRLDDPRRALAAGRITGALEIYDGYTNDVVEIDGESVPLEVEPSAAFASTLSESAIWDWELRGFLVGDLLKGFVVASKAGEARAQLLFMQPYRRGRIPVVFVHGTASGPGRWADMMNSLENDPWLRTRFQYWFFYYDTGNPITYSADVLRLSLRVIVEQLDPNGDDAALRQMVIIGHSQGGLLAKMTAIDSGTRLWDTVSQRPLDDLILRDETREQLRRTLFLQPLPFVRRVIFIATPHRGSYEAGSWIAQQIAGFASLPKGFVDVMKDLVTGNPSAVTLSLGGLPRSINDMTPGKPFVQTLASIPVVPGVTTHSIIAVSGDHPLAEDDDGIVKYTSAHLDDVESELVIHSGHSVQGHPLAIAEARRILYLHGEEACRSAGVCGVTDNR
ncbi:MAG TPA: alpha/beta fold hydrolase [Candidatus Binatia bacterium]|nr:alpha/beta fold hydrolase [Candidatus Binatia bacterium]